MLANYKNTTFVNKQNSHVRLSCFNLDMNVQLILVTTLVGKCNTFRTVTNGMQVVNDDNLNMPEHLIHNVPTLTCHFDNYIRKDHYLLAVSMLQLIVVVLIELPQTCFVNIKMYFITNESEFLKYHTRCLLAKL